MPRLVFMSEIKFDLRDNEKKKKIIFFLFVLCFYLQELYFHLLFNAHIRTLIFP